MAVTPTGPPNSYSWCTLSTSLPVVTELEAVVELSVERFCLLEGDMAKLDGLGRLRRDGVTLKERDQEMYACTRIPPRECE